MADQKKAKRRRPKASGGLSQRTSDGMWVASVELPSIGGKRRRKVIVRARKEDAVKALRDLNRDLAKFGDLGGSSPTVEAWCEDWIKRYLPKRKPTTWENDEGLIRRYIIPSMGKVRLDKLTVKRVHDLHDWITSAPPEGLGLSPTTSRNAHRMLSTILEAAFAEEKVPRNVAKVAGAPAPALSTATHLTSAQVRTLLLSLDTEDGTVSQDLALMALSYLTGMRPAERLGLTRDMIDLGTGTITVAWQLQRIKFEHACGPKPKSGESWPCGRRKGGYCPKRREIVPKNVEARRVEGGLWMVRPKSRAGWREIPMAGPLCEVMAAYLATHEPGMEGLVFTRPRGGKGKGAIDGRPLDPAAYSARWDELLRAAGLPDVTPHSARHSCNTILAELGVPPEVRIKIIGHAGERVNQVYTHEGDGRARAAAGELGTALTWR